MSIKIEYAPRENCYVWAIFKNGQRPVWHNGRRSVEDTKTFVQSLFPLTSLQYTVS